MGTKDMKEKMTSEPLVKVVKAGGVVNRELILNPGEESEDVLLDTLSADLPNTGSPTGLARFNPGRGGGNTDKAVSGVDKYRNKTQNKGATGFKSFELNQEVSDKVNANTVDDEDTLIEDAIIKGRAQADITFKPLVLAAYKKIEAAHKDLPKDWRKYQQIAEAIFNKISRETNLPVSGIDLLLEGIGEG